MHVDLIVTSWSVLCHVHTIQNNQDQLGKFSSHVLPDNKKRIEDELNVKELPYFCVGDVEYSPVPVNIVFGLVVWSVSVVVVQFDSLRSCSCVVCGVCF